MQKLKNSPEYSKMFANGVLNVTMAVGYDEGKGHKVEDNEIAQIVTGLAARGYRLLDLIDMPPEQRKRKGIHRKAIDTSDQWFEGSFKHGKKDIQVALELITRNTVKAKQKFARAISSHELVMYTGHGRYGSGPDFDHIDSKRGNFVIGAPYKKHVVQLGDNDLQKTKMTSSYQLLFFDGCSTKYYIDDLRSIPKGKTTKNLDIIGTSTELDWVTSAEDLLSLLDSVTKVKSFKEIIADLQRINVQGANDKTTYFFVDGFEDNPTS
jgi:hypothetical protein